MFHLPKMSQREQYTKQKLYEEAFNVSFNWEKYLSPKCFKFHDLTCREINSPISLQMGVMLPFVSACLGPTTRGCFMTRSSVLNLFWLNVAASGVGKSETRKRLVSELLEYIFGQKDVKLEDFEVSKELVSECSITYKVFAISIPHYIQSSNSSKFLYFY